MNKQFKYMLIELAAGTAVIAAAAFFAAEEVQNKLDRFYADSVQSAANIIASEASGLSSIYPDTSNRILADTFKDFLNRNSDISYIEYKDIYGSNIFSINENIPSEERAVSMHVSAPVMIKGRSKGSVSAGFTGREAAAVSKAANKSLFGIFIITWLFFSAVLILNMRLISKELKKLYKGVKNAASGGLLSVKSENMKELADAFNDVSNMMIKKGEENIEKLCLERNKFEAVLMSIINGVIMCDIYDRVMLANSAALKILDISEKEFINTKIQDYIDAGGKKCFMEKIEEFKETPLNIREQKPVEFNIEAGKRTIKAAISPMFLKQRDYAGYIIVLIDITREEEVSRLKNTFISNVSHELRTPVTVLRTYIDTLCHNADDFDEGTKKEFLETIDKEAERLHAMVNEILDFSRLENETAVLHKEYADLTELLIQNISSIKILADEKNIKMKFIQNGRLPKIPINIESMDRAVRNLLSNAVKYSPAGRDITITAGMSEDKQQAVFSVKDEGIGIAKEHLDKIFDRFYRVENAAHTIKGTGLGLHLVKITIEKHHGRITVSSEENKGSVFTVYLPVSADDNELA